LYASIVAFTRDPPWRCPFVPTGVPPTTETAAPSPSLVLPGHSSPRPTSLAVSLQRASAEVSTLLPLGKTIVVLSVGVYTSSELSAVPWSSIFEGSIRLLLDAAFFTLLGFSLKSHDVPDWPSVAPASAV
jgi:hypothetical protein